MTQPGIDKYKDIYQPEDIPSSKPLPEPPRNKFIKVASFVILTVLLIGAPIYYYVSQRGIGWFGNSEGSIQVEKGKEIIAVHQLMKEGKAYLTIGIGCTGGRHRSTAIVEHLADMFKDEQININVLHRDL